MSGSLTNLGNVYRFRIKVINVETARIETQASYNMGNDQQVTFLLNGSQGSAPPVASAPPPSAEGTAPKPALAPAPAPTTYKIGDTGPAGGIVFYDKGNNSDGWRYLEAASKSAETKAQWGMYGSTVGRTKTEVGTGKANTDFIMRAMQDREESGRAVQIARQCKQGGYSDWFLPSKVELNLMYWNVKQKGLGGFKDEWYWSSSEYDYSNYTWAQRFSDGSQDYSYKSPTYVVRAVRAF